MIRVIENIDEHNREVWTFNEFNLNFVLVNYLHEVKPPRKRKWRINSYWNKYDNRGSNLKEHPTLEKHIKNGAKEEVIKKINILTWSEWKSKL